MSKRSIRNGEDKDPTSGEPKVHHNSADKESESNGAASKTADQAKLTAEYPPSLSSTPATIYQTSELVRTDDSAFTPNEFRNLASNSLGDGETASAEAHEAKLSSDDNLQNKYCYSPLSEQGSIRLLRLMPDKDKKASIQCQLFEYPLEEQGEGTYLYEALSGNSIVVLVLLLETTSAYLLRQTFTRHCHTFEIDLWNESYG
ncbi:hypothetical protein B0I35DRAFT_87839 [Stachybotrys elegans]|uniref:Uncharacterized protein n=1 Tax=Stachybotrys elegans TaxID=80388 RepID=A0A8K0SKJ3_9HYPO|nr:hypothetical protein B0I35DRAFT_87839 [Stachybotrys elegans]